LFDLKLLPQLYFDEMITLQQDSESESIFQKYRSQASVNLNPEIETNFFIELIVGVIGFLRHAVCFSALYRC
jgi:hypothetical protein